MVYCKTTLLSVNCAIIKDMVTKLTPKQAEVLDTIRHLTEVEGTPPTLRRLMVELNLGQLSSVQRHVEALRDKGVLLSKPWQRGVQLRTAEVKQIPLLGGVSCGAPLLAEEHIEALVPYSTSKLKSDTDQYFFLRASGDSMDKAKKPGPIADGDLLLVRQQQIASVDETIVALIGDDTTCKVLERSSEGWYRLAPRSSNAAHKPRVMLEEFSVLGVVEDVVRAPWNEFQ